MPYAKRPSTCPKDWRPPRKVTRAPVQAWAQVGWGAFEAHYGEIGTAEEVFLQVVRMAKPVPDEEGNIKPYQAFRNHKPMGFSYSIDGAQRLAEGIGTPQALHDKLAAAARRSEETKARLAAECVAMSPKHREAAKWRAKKKKKRG